MSEVRSVAVYVPGLGGGGAERVAAVLASGFQAAGLETTLLVDHIDETNRGFLDPAVRLVPLLGSHIATVRRLAAWLAHARPDIALAIDGPANVKLVAARLLSRAPTRVVLSYHGRSEIVRGLIGRSAYWLAPVLTRLAAHTVCVSHDLRRHLVTRWKAAAGRLTTIHNPVPVEHARPTDATALARRLPLIVAAGRLVPEKGFAVLIGALPHLPSDTRLLILGEGPERAALEDQARRLGVADRVHLPGYLADPWGAYGEARAFALTSSSEAFGNVVVEALASGLPVVATDCGGPREILEDGRHGVLVPVGNVPALADALRGLLAHPGDPAPRQARAGAFATGRVTQTYLDLFSAVLSGRPVRPPAGSSHARAGD